MDSRSLILFLGFTFLYLGIVSSDSDCPDFTHKPPLVPPNVTCTTDANCGSEEECCPYQGQNYCVPEIDDDHHKKKDDDEECNDDDDDDDHHHKKGHHGGKRECHKRYGKIVCVVAIAIGCLLVTTITVLCHQIIKAEVSLTSYSDVEEVKKILTISTALTIEHYFEHQRTPSKLEVGPGAREKKLNQIQNRPGEIYESFRNVFKENENDTLGPKAFDCIKKCCAKKRKVTSSTLELREEKYPSSRGREYAIQVFQESEQVSTEKKNLKEKEALDAWTLRTQSQDNVPLPAPPSYGPVVPPAYTSSPPPSYHI